MSEERKPSKSLQQLLRERQDLERELKDQHTRLVAVLFTDIVGSTTFFERRGDIEGMAMVQRHNSLLMPLVKEHHGRLVKTIGDAIMAVFEQPANAVRCGVAMQRRLVEARGVADEDPIHVRIGAHAGRVIVKEEDDSGPFDVFGDAVNTAARIEAKADGDELLVSEELFQMVPDGESLEAVPGGTLPLKGKAEPLPVVAILWGPEAPRRRPTSAGTPESRPAPPKELFVLELTLGPTGLKVASIDGRADKGTVKTYTEVPVSLADLDHFTRSFDTFLQGGGADSYLKRLRELGQRLYSKALPERTRDRLAHTQQRYVRLQLDDQLAHVPWELLFDGKKFLSLRFATGRQISARAERNAPYADATDRAGHALVVANPSGDLAHAGEEGQAVAGLLRDGFVGEVRHIDGPCTKAAFLQALRGAQILHFAGHAISPGPEHRGGFQLSDGVATPDDVAAAVGGAPPALVFANTCYASTDTGWSEAARGVTDLASALLLQGVRHYLGPLGGIPDADALGFALRFYEQVLSGAGFGDGVRHARAALHQQASGAISFARYVLYGDPRTRLAPGQTRLSLEPTRSTGPSMADPGLADDDWDDEETHTRHGSVTRVQDAVDVDALRRADLGQPPRRGASRLALGGLVAGVAVLLGAVGLYFIDPFGRGGTTDAPTPGGTPTPLAVAAMSRTGPIRMSVLPFKNISGNASLDPMSEGLAADVITDFGTSADFQLVERLMLENKEIDRAGLVDLDILGELEFTESRFVDKKTAAALGKLKGTEVLVVGGIQQAGNQLRVTLRFVDVETGEIILATHVQGPDKDIFGLQDKVAAKAREAKTVVRDKLRPQ